METNHNIDKNKTKSLFKYHYVVWKQIHLLIGIKNPDKV